MPVVTVVPTPIPVGLVDHLVDVGGTGDGAPVRGRGQGRRRADKSDAQGHQRSDEDCTHFDSPWFLATLLIAIGPNPNPRIQNSAWLSHSSLVHGAGPD